MGLDTDGLEGSHPLGSLMLLSPGGGGGGGGSFMSNHLAEALSKFKCTHICSGSAWLQGFSLSITG